MADDSLALFDFFDDVFPTSELVLFPRRNPFDDYDEKKFRARFRLSNSSVVSGGRGNEYNNAAQHYGKTSRSQRQRDRSG